MPDRPLRRKVRLVGCNFDATAVAVQDVLPDRADVAVFGIDHLGAARLGDLGEQQISVGRRNAPVVLHPVDQLLEGDAHGVLERPGAADRAVVGRGLDARPGHARRRLGKPDPDAQLGCDLDGAHADALAVALDRVAVAEEQMRALMQHPEHHLVAGGDLLDVEIAAVRAVVDRQHRAVLGRHACDPDHRPDRQLQLLVPVDDAVLDLDHLGLDAELVVPHPVREDADAGPQRAEAQPLDLHVEHLDGQHVAGPGAVHLDRAGGAIDIGQLDIVQLELLAETGDHAVIDVDRAFDVENLAGLDRADERVVGRERVFDVVLLGDGLAHGRPPSCRAGSGVVRPPGARA